MLSNYSSYKLLPLLLVSTIFTILTKSEETSSKNRLLLISFDGFRWDYLDNHKAETKNIQKLANLGLRAKWTKDQFITKTFPNHWTIATGLFEENHGIVNNHFWDPKFKKEFTYSNDDEFWSGEPIWNTFEKKDKFNRKSATFFWPGSDVKKTAPSAYISPYDASIPFKTRADRVISWLRNKDYGFISAYVNEPDHSGHQFGPDSPEVAEAIKRCDDFLGFILQEVHKQKTFYEDLTIILTSDHGMTQLDEEKVVFLQEYLDPKILGEHYIDYYTGGHVWCDQTKNENDISNCDKIYEQLKNVENLHVWRKGYSEAEGGIPEKFHYTNNYRIPPIVLNVDSPYQVHINKTSYHPLNGQHGFNNESPNMHPIFVAAGKEIKKFEEDVVEPFDSINLYSFFCKILDVEPAPNNGSWENIEHFFKDDGIDWFYLGEIELGEHWGFQKVMGVICMFAGLVVALISIFCIEDGEGNSEGKEYLILNDDLGNDAEWNGDVSESESSSKIQVSSFHVNKNSENQRTFVID